MVSDNISLKEKLYKLFIYGVIYCSFAISLLFTIGGALFSIPPVCVLLGIGTIGQFIIGALCVAGAFWGTYVVQGDCLKKLILNISGINPKDGDNIGQDINKDINKDASRASDKLKSKNPINNSIANYIKKSLVVIMLAANAVFFIAGGYFGMLSILFYIGIQTNVIAAVSALVLAIINYLPTFALNGIGLYNSAMGVKNTDLDRNIERYDAVIQVEDAVDLSLSPSEFTRFHISTQASSDSSGALILDVYAEKTVSSRVSVSL